jgi:hypothetical protein
VADSDAAPRAKILALLPVDAAALLSDVGCDDGAWTDEARFKLGIAVSQVYGIVAKRAPLARAVASTYAAATLGRWPGDTSRLPVSSASI